METEIKTINGRTVCDTTAREAAREALEKTTNAGITAKIVDGVLVVTNEETEG